MSEVSAGSFVRDFFDAFCRADFAKPRQDFRDRAPAPFTPAER
ncbi:hypothetical protein OG223_06765 [Streptomyces sp. NBC_01478]|nr:hypothetical protein [Streptomyces sp. NBC_01478]